MKVEGRKLLTLKLYSAEQENDIKLVIKNNGLKRKVEKSLKRLKLNVIAALEEKVL